MVSAFWCGFLLLGADVGWCELIIEPLASLVSIAIFDNEGNCCFTLWMGFPAKRDKVSPRLELIFSSFCWDPLLFLFYNLVEVVKNYRGS